ncbi:MAG: DMT family transporter [Elusimicrobia bacterium]|nr:DMT family transporter [Elusimicrobiota bacterium]
MKTNSKQKAVLYLLCASFFFACVSLLVRYATKDMGIHVFTIVFIRGLLSLPFLFLMTRLRGEPAFGKDIKTLCLRGLVGAGGMFFSFLALSKTIVSNAMVLTYTYPIFAALISSFAGKERLGKRAILLLLSFTGIGMIIRPELGSIDSGELMGLAAGIFAGASIYFVRELRKTDTPFNITKYLIMFTFVISAPYAALSFRRYTPAEILIMILISAAALAAQHLMTSGYRECTTVEGGVLSYISVIIAIIGALFIFSEIPDRMDLAGGLIVITSSIILIVLQNRKSHIKFSF